MPHVAIVAGQRANADREDDPDQEQLVEQFAVPLNLGHASSRPASPAPSGAGFFSPGEARTCFLRWWLVLPLLGPPFLVVVIWQFTHIWNEFLFAVTLARLASRPITVALANLAGGQAVSRNLPMAGSVLAALPTVVVYVLLGRYFIRGLLADALKG